MSDPVSRFAALFAGRQDAFGEEDGGCHRVADGGYDNTSTYYNDHLRGIDPIGVYPMVPRAALAMGDDWSHWYVRWGCVDFDIRSGKKPSGDYLTEHGCHAAAVALVVALQHVSVTGWIEVTRTRGRHVWVFADSWVPAATMRRALLVACGVAGVPTREVNPKQEKLDVDSLGNYVRLPYPGALAREPIDNRWIYGAAGDGCDLVLKLARFLDLAETSLTHLSTLTQLANLYAPPEKKVYSPPRRPWTEYTGDLNGLGKKMVQEGPLPDMDRSGYLYKLACVCRDSGLTEGEAVAVVRTADEVHTRKFSERRDSDKRYDDLTRSAYSSG